MPERIVTPPSLRVALVLYVIIPLMIAGALVSYFGLRVYESHIEERMEEDVELVARTMELTIGRAIERDRLGTVNRALESAFTLHRVYGAYVYDQEGELISSLGAFADQPDEETLAETTEMGQRQGGYEEVAGQAVYSYFVPLTNSFGQPNGLLQVTRRASDIQQTIDALRWQGGTIISIALVLLTGLVLWGHHGAIGRHLNSLGKSMARVESGDRSHRAPVKGPREIAALGATLNTMLDSIEEAQIEIRERRAAQENLERQLQQAEKLAAIGQLSAGIAHELGTPLSIIDGKAQRLLRSDHPGAESHEALEDIRAEVRRMERIVRQLLDFGRRPNLRRRAVQASQLTEMALSGLREEATQRNVQLETGTDRSCEEIYADPVLLERALANLIDNAIEATPGGTVRITTNCNETQVQFVVEDDGPGIADDIGHRIFEPFFTTKEVGEGTGLGLAVVHGIVEEHNGTVKIQDSDLGGTKMIIELPRTTHTESIRRTTA